MNRLLALFFYAVARALAASYRFEPRGLDNLAQARRCGNGGYVLAIWHQNLLAGILAQIGGRHVVIVSRSRHADPVAYLCRKIGCQVVRGSSKRCDRDRGGKQAKDEMIELLRAGLPGAVTVDGPIGPPHAVKPGIVEMARSAGVPVVPYLPVPARYWSFPSWDRFRLPKPFSRIYVYYGTPLAVARDTPYEAFGALQQRISEELGTLERAHVA